MARYEVKPRSGERGALASTREEAERLQKTLGGEIVEMEDKK